MSFLRHFSPPTRDQVIALAGVFQACQLVETTAQTGITPSEPFAASVHSIFEQNPKDTESVFGSVASLRIGLDTLEKALNIQSNKQIADTLRYAIGVTHLQRTLLKNKNILDKLGTGIDNATLQAAHFEENHENVIANLANLYQETLSTFNYRIQVNGQPTYLQQPAVANRIRTLLLAGVRASVLWNQLGGSRMQLMLQRKQLEKHIKQLKKEL